jgi:Tfp pilus assembly protein PilN
MRAVNLIPTEQRKGGAVGRRSQGAAFAVLGLLAGAAILTFMYGMADHQVESRKAEAAKLTARAATVQSEAAQLTPYTSFMQMREQRLQTIAQLINSRFDWSSAMGELSRVLPAGVSLSSLEATVAASATASTSSSAAAKPAAASSSPSSSSGSSSATPANGTPTAAAATSAAATSATPAGATPTFTLAGCAVSQTVVAQTLVRLRLVSGVSGVTLQSSTESSSGGGGSSGGSCPAEAPAFSVDVAFQPLPAPPSTSTETLEATADPSSSAGATHKHVVSSVTKGASR